MFPSSSSYQYSRVQSDEAVHQCPDCEKHGCRSSTDSQNAHVVPDPGLSQWITRFVHARGLQVLLLLSLVINTTLLLHLNISPAHAVRERSKYGLFIPDMLSFELGP